MQAIIWTRYGGPEGLQLQEMAQPVPKPHEILIKIHASSVTAGDREVRSMQIPSWVRVPMRLYVGLFRPRRVKVLGQELAGEVAALGAAVTRFRVGDPVFAASGLRFGGYAEYICLPETGPIARKPATMSYAEAAAVPTAGLEAWHFLHKGAIRAGEKMLINGAGGSIGTFSVQLARYVGAEVTAVDSGDKLAMLRRLGADHVLDYTRTDFTQTGQTYDVVLDVVGTLRLSQALAVLKPAGRYLVANPSLEHKLRGPARARAVGKQVIADPAVQTAADLDALRDLIEAGHLKSEIDRCFPLAETAAAHCYADSGRKQGNIIITVTPEPQAGCPARPAKPLG